MLPEAAADDAADCSQQGRLARPVGAEDGDETAGAHLDRDVAQGLDRTVSDVEIGDFQHQASSPR